MCPCHFSRTTLQVACVSCRCYMYTIKYIDRFGVILLVWLPIFYGFRWITNQSSSGLFHWHLRSLMMCKYRKSPWTIWVKLTHWERGKMAAISLATFSKDFFKNENNGGLIWNSPNFLTWAQFLITQLWCEIHTLNDVSTSEWRHNERNGVSNSRRLHCLLNCWFSRRSKKTSKFCFTGLCEGNSPVTDEFPAQRASNAENVSKWWSHHNLILF